MELSLKSINQESVNQELVNQESANQELMNHLISQAEYVDINIHIPKSAIQSVAKLLPKASNDLSTRTDSSNPTSNIKKNIIQKNIIQKNIIQKNIIQVNTNKATNKLIYYDFSCPISVWFNQYKNQFNMWPQFLKRLEQEIEFYNDSRTQIKEMLRQRIVYKKGYEEIATFLNQSANINRYNAIKIQRDIDSLQDLYPAIYLACGFSAYKRTKNSIVPKRVVTNLKKLGINSYPSRSIRIDLRTISYSDRQNMREQIISLYQNGKNAKQISNMLSVTYDTVKKLITRYKKGINVIHEHKRGKPRVLDMAEEEKIKDIIYNYTAELKINKSSWRPEAVQLLISKKLNKQISRSTAFNYLRRWNIIQ